MWIRDSLYTLDGSSPKEDGRFYQEPFPMEKEGKYTRRAVCVDARGIYSKEVKVKYEIDLDVPDLPTASPASGTYTQPTKITIDVPVGCRAYYCLLYTSLLMGAFSIGAYFYMA